MAVAEFPVGNYPVAYTEATTMIVTAVDLVEGRRSLRNLPWPLLRFWDIATPEGTKYYVDFAHPDCAGTNPDEVAFDSQDYQAIQLLQPPSVTSLEGAPPTLELTVFDPYHTVLGFLRDNDCLRGEQVRLRTIWYDQISDPTLADEQYWYIQNAYARDSFDRVTIVMGMPNLFDIELPRLAWNRRRCHNLFHLRYLPLNECRYPSDEFEAASEQGLSETTDTELEREHGWYTVNPSKALQWTTNTDPPATGTDQTMHCWINPTASVDIRWLDTNRNGPYMYKKVSGDFDVYTKMTTGTGTRAQWLCGILVQNTADLSDWLFYGWHEDTGAIKYIQRKTANGSSADTQRGTNPPYHTAFRMKRETNDFKLYSRYADVTTFEDDNPDDSDWTYQATEAFNIDTDVNVGLVIAGDTVDSTTFLPYFFYFRFLEGGETECNRSLTNCSTLTNTYQFNGFLGMPQNIAF